MSKKLILFLFLIFILISACTPSIYITNKSYVRSLLEKESLNKNTKKNSFESQLLAKAEKNYKKEIKTILDKKRIPPSENMQDYLSTAIYYWPEDINSKKPWKYIDGKVNKKNLSDTDHNNYYEMLDAVKNLSLAYYFSKDEKYAKKCTEIIELWFINKKTRMNPHFNYAQGIPGKTTGTPSGIIDARGILWVIDTIEFIEDSEYWTNTKNDNFKNWINGLYNWLLNSEFGKREGNSKNNHGTFYELQVIKMGMHLDDNDIVFNFFERVKDRITWQIANDGSQPLEMERASSHMYSIFNLSALVEIAFIAKQFEVDLWTYKGVNSGSIEDAVDFLVDKYKLNDRKTFKGKVSYKNLLRILPKANELSENKYGIYSTGIKEKNKNLDLTQLYFFN